MFSYACELFSSVYELFSVHQVRKKFKVHRVWGALYLCQWAAAAYFELVGRPRRILFWIMPLTGWLQAIIACRTFTFLPKADDRVQGYYDAKKAMSYDFILENVYFSGLLLWQSVYLCFASYFHAHLSLLPLEVLCNFFPYYTIRPLFPKSSFRHSTKNGNKYAQVVKVFYVIAKHFSGYYVNYLCFLGKLGEDPVMDYALVRSLFLLAGWGTTIAMFLQTLKFRRHISPTAAMLLYAGSFPFFYTCYAGLIAISVEHAWVTLLTLAGLVANFSSNSVQVGWQVAVCAIMLSHRIGRESPSIEYASLVNASLVNASLVNTTARCSTWPLAESAELW